MVSNYVNRSYLERSLGRLRDIQSHLATCNLNENTLRVSAIDGRSLTDNELAAHGVTPRTQLRILQHEKKRTGLSRVHDHWMLDSRAAIGATLSHVRCWEWLVDTSDEEYVVVLEDDARFVNSRTIQQELQQLADQQLFGYDVLLLGVTAFPSYAPQPRAEPCTPGRVCTHVHDFIGMQSYICSKRGAAILQQNARPIEQHVDFFVATMAQLGVVNVGVICPALARTSYSAWATSTIPHSFVLSDWLPSVLALVVVVCIAFVTLCISVTQRENGND